jgi:hypothetical protein
VARKCNFPGTLQCTRWCVIYKYMQATPYHTHTAYIQPYAYPRSKLNVDRAPTKDLWIGAPSRVVAASLYAVRFLGDGRARAHRARGIRGARRARRPSSGRRRVVLGVEAAAAAGRRRRRRAGVVLRGVRWHREGCVPLRPVVGRRRRVQDVRWIRSRGVPELPWLRHPQTRRRPGSRARAEGSGGRYERQMTGWVCL